MNYHILKKKERKKIHESIFLADLSIATLQYYNASSHNTSTQNTDYCLINHKPTSVDIKEHNILISYPPPILHSYNNSRQYTGLMEHTSIL